MRRPCVAFCIYVLYSLECNEPTRVYSSFSHSTKIDALGDYDNVYIRILDLHRVDGGSSRPAGRVGPGRVGS
jgi:hypothetical protein